MDRLPVELSQFSNAGEKLEIITAIMESIPETIDHGFIRQSFTLAMDKCMKAGNMFGRDTYVMRDTESFGMISVRGCKVDVVVKKLGS